MINRKYYLEKIQPYLGKPVVKTVTGLRRVGKSVFVRQLIEHLRNQGIAPDNILYVDMESLDFDFIRTYNDLHKHVTKMTDKVSGKIYIFVDEIQDITEWERVVASWSGQPERYDVTITGSNSAMFSGELASKLTGRFIEFPVFPLS